ncbi:MAG: endonuclease [Ectothiorhodospiraceae bacterium]|nr:endonuclease [Ectothiorhodospiraceae bacterium]
MKRTAPLRRFLWPGALLLSLFAFLLFGQAAEGRCDTALEQPLADILGHTGSGAAEEGAVVTTGGVVTGVYPGREALNGFFLQSPGAGESVPSGLFVYAPGLSDGQWQTLEPGVRVQLKALVGEYRGWPQLHRVDSVRVCAHPGLPDPVVLELPLEPTALDRYHGLLVDFPQQLVVTGNYELGRFGSLALSAEQRLLRERSGARDDRLHQITLDDGSYRSNPDPVPYLDDSNTRRSGDRVQQLRAVLAHAFDAWRLHPVEPPVFESANPRPGKPDALAGLRLATLNVENYFLTLGERGAADQAALRRQRGKLLAALRGLDADLVALVELENRAGVLDDLLRHMNDGVDEQARYQRLDGVTVRGGDRIKVALIYRPSRLEARTPVLLDDNQVHRRPPVAALFRPHTGGEPFLATVVHHKAKSGCPPSGDVDEGQGCWNRERTAQSRALL